MDSEFENGLGNHIDLFTEQPSPQTQRQGFPDTSHGVARSWKDPLNWIASVGRRRLQVSDIDSLYKGSQLCRLLPLQPLPTLGQGFLRCRLLSSPIIIPGSSPAATTSRPLRRKEENVGLRESQDGAGPDTLAAFACYTCTTACADIILSCTQP